MTGIVDWTAEWDETTKEVIDSAHGGVDERQLFLLVLIQRLSGRGGHLCG